MKKASTVVKEMESRATKSPTSTKRPVNAQRDQWVKATKEKMSNLIEEKAKAGLRELEFSLNELVQGAENLKEAAEMCEIFDGILAEYEYKHKLTQEGKFIISW